MCGFWALMKTYPLLQIMASGQTCMNKGFVKAKVMYLKDRMPEVCIIF